MTDESTSTSTPVTTVPPSVLKAKSKRKGGGGGGYGKYISTMLMVVVVMVVYWEESGLNNLFVEDEGPSELSWKDDSKLWNQESVLFNDSGYTCRWITYQSSSSSSSSSSKKGGAPPPIQVCVHPGETDYLSNIIGGGGSGSKQCELQTKQWDHKHAKQVYLEIGAHVGICVLEMLFSTKATVIAVEAHPHNLFALTSTLLKNPKLLERVSVLPVALGREQSSTADTAAAAAMIDDGNNGDLVQAKIVPPSSSSSPDQQQKQQAMNIIQMERLDDLILPGGLQLVSLHVNGYECNVLDGGLKVFRKVTTIAFSVNPSALTPYACSSDLLLAKVTVLSNRQAPKWYRQTGRLRPLPNKKMGFNAVAKKQW
eukprot:CAMPEP_0119014956 /NCGR_PEP_ID=MMETSP1176-20130426/10476_1 /TAXON_ID=265551 /ORGANISM="Synedropsis recta cf, Strain CCMP1620" /LENGTH=368 /DNA_ID=CAMNT_0006968207 /DNA_START=55 /DNA_END=1161 /DNA_ORIENTATION=+